MEKIIGFFTTAITLLSVSCLALNSTTDQLALLAFKTRVTSDPYSVLTTNWSTNTSICNWIGVSCSTKHQRVIALNFSDFDFGGTIAPHLGNITFLHSLDLSYNNFTATVPPELSKLRHLKTIDVGFNSFTGDIPSWLATLPEIERIFLDNNSFTGSISPSSCRNSSKLQILQMRNNFINGVIPQEIGNLSALVMLGLRSNELMGEIPRGIFNMSSLEVLDLPFNSLSGRLPENMCDGASKLWGLHLSKNLLYGQIPASIFRCRYLEELSLAYNQFNGSIPSAIGSLTLLRSLYLGTNDWEGGIPMEIGNLSTLEVLSIPGGSLTGQIPSSIFNITSLKGVDLSNNSLSGSLSVYDYHKLLELEQLFLISNQLTGSISNVLDCKNLRVLSLSDNNLTGGLPAKVGNLTGLKDLFLAYNRFTGELPEELGNLDLEKFNVRNNSLSGVIPVSMFNISTIRMIELSANQFSGHLPSTIGFSVMNLEELYVDSNKLTGVIPSSITNASKLTTIDMGSNSFTGQMPDFGNLRLLQRLLIEENNLTGDPSSNKLTFFSSLTNCRYLIYIGVSLNQLNGILPASIGNFSTSLKVLRAFGCQIKGSIPNEIGNLSSLIDLYLDSNQLTGSIPSSLGKLRSLERVYLEYNKLDGHIPSELCHLSTLGDLYLSNNRVYGSIPTCLGDLKSFRRLYLDSNKLESNVPLNLWYLRDVLELNLSSNRLGGSIPSEIKNLEVVNQLDLSQNQFSGEIPSSIGSMESLVLLSLARNKFQGSIPESLKNVRNLESLDLSHNNFSGSIPKSLENLKYLQYLDVSHNRLEGEIPVGGCFANFTAQSFLRNYGLCSEILQQFPHCYGRSKSKNAVELMKYILPPIVAIILVTTIVLLMIRRRKSRKQVPERESSLGTSWKRVSYQELQEATNGFSETNILGSGSFGSVYKGMLSDGLNVAVKVFNLQSERVAKSFDTESEILSTIRHRNLIKIVGYCSNTEFKALILEYMPNGSLEKWLYSHERFLGVLRRLNIAIDVALAIEYLHHGLTFTVLHCDLKPSNVLLDKDMVGHVGDFGIAKLFDEGESMDRTKTLGTIGYMAPEYGTEGIVSSSGDVYSFGIMLLEMYTGKKPTDDIFGENMSLKSWVHQSLDENKVTEVVDANLLRRDINNFSEMKQCVSSILALAMECLVESPMERIDMMEVVARLEKIKKTFPRTAKDAKDGFAEEIDEQKQTSPAPLLSEV